MRGQVPGKLLLGHALAVGGYGAALRTMTDGSLGRHFEPANRWVRPVSDAARNHL